jgi:O-antigen/teichoic acid export membrane protein
MSLGRKATIGAGWMIAWRGFARALGFVNTLILARLLVPADFGLVSMAMTFEVALQQIAAFPVYDALLRRPETDTHLHDVAFTIQVARAALTALILVICAPLAAAWFGEPRLTALILVLAAASAANGFSNIGIVEFQRELRFNVQFKLELVPALAHVLTTLAVAWLTRSYWALLAGLVMLRLSRIAMSYLIHPYRPRFSLRGWRQLIGFSFWLWLSSLVNIAWNDFDPFAVGRMFGPTGLGLYTLANQVARLPTTELVDPISSVLLASFAYQQRDLRSDDAAPLRVILGLLLLIAPMVLLISAGAADFVSLLLGAKWLAAAPLVVIAAWGTLFHPVHYVCSAALVARGNVRGKFYVTAMGAVLRVALVTLAVFTGNLSVVIVATLVALGGGAVFYLALLKSTLRSKGVGFLAGLLRIAAGTAATGLLLRMLNLGWQPPMDAALDNRSRELLALFHLAGAGAVTVAAYGAIILLLWLISGRPDGPEKLVLGVLRHFVPVGIFRGVAARPVSPPRQ